MSSVTRFVPVVVIAVACGCSAQPVEKLDKPLVPVRGKLSFQGKPMTNAIVTLHPVTPISVGENSKAQVSRTPFGVAGSDGTFAVTTLKPSDGAPEGEYAVTISWAGGIAPKSDNDAVPELLPPQYQNPTASGIRVQVRQGQPELPEIKLN